MRRRKFLVVCVEGTIIGVVGCVPPSPVRVPAARESSSEDAEAAAADVGPDSGPVSSTSKDAAAHDSGAADSGTSPPPEPDSGMDASAPDPVDSGVCNDFVMMHDTYAQALYLDGSLGPLTGTIFVSYVIAGLPVELQFWHGHGGVDHMFTLLPQHFEGLKRGERVMIETTEVDSHQHQLFIDPLDLDYQVPGSQPTPVPLC